MGQFSTSSIEAKRVNCTFVWPMLIQVPAYMFSVCIYPTFDAHSLLQLNPFHALLHGFGNPRTLFIEERDIGEEYRYVLERQGAENFPAICSPPGTNSQSMVRSFNRNGEESCRKGGKYADRQNQSDLRARSAEGCQD